MQRRHSCGKFAWEWSIARHLKFLRNVLVEPHLCESCWLGLK